MLIEEGRVMFGEWLPDLPAFENPGLVDARNCLPVDSSYGQFPSVSVSGDTLAAAPIGAYATIDSSGNPEIYAGTQTKLYQRVGTSWTDRSGAAYTAASTDYWRFTQFNGHAIATNFTDVPQFRSVGSASNFAALASTGAAPKARQIGVINQFVFLGDLDDGVNLLPFSVQWSAIGDDRNWPTPNTASARTVQSGQQTFNSIYGSVTGISAGQFWGLIFQKRGITRATYVGGDVVFQFETFEQNRGCWAPQSLIQVGGLVYFLAHDGWCVTDGQTVVQIGAGKVDRWFYSRVDQTRLQAITVGVDWTSKCIVWNFPDAAAASGYTNYMLALNFNQKRFAYAEESCQLMLQSFSQTTSMDSLDTAYPSLDDLAISLDSPAWQGGTPTLMCFDQSQMGTLSGDALDALFETGENAPNAFGFTFIRGVRPLVTGQPSTVAVQIGTRKNQDDSRSYTNETNRTTRTGVCDFRQNGQFLTARLAVRGGFERAIGLGVDFEISDLQ